MDLPVKVQRVLLPHKLPGAADAVLGWRLLPETARSASSCTEPHCIAGIQRSLHKQLKRCYDKGGAESSSSQRLFAAQQMQHVVWQSCQHIPAAEQLCQSVGAQPAAVCAAAAGGSTLLLVPQQCMAAADGGICSRGWVAAVSRQPTLPQPQSPAGQCTRGVQGCLARLSSRYSTSRLHALKEAVARQQQQQQQLLLQ